MFRLVVWSEKINKKLYLNLNVELKNLKKCATIIYLWITVLGSRRCCHTKSSCFGRTRNADSSSDSVESCCRFGRRHKSVLWVSGELLSFFFFLFHFYEKKTVFWVFLDFLLVFLIFIFSSRYFQRNNSMKLKKPSARWERALSIVILINFRKIFHVISECVSRNCFSIPGTIQWIWSLSLCCSRNRWDLPSNEPSFPNH